MKDFSGKNALITGGASGIGLAAAEELAARGANILIFDLDGDAIGKAMDRLKPMTEKSGADCEGKQGDVADFNAVKRAVDEWEDEEKPVDLLITSAGIAHPGELFSLDPEIIKKTIDIDLLGTLYSCRAVLPGMVKRECDCHIVLISSVAGILGVYGYSAYGAAKFGVRGVGEVLLQELKPHNIPVTVLFPPDTDTPQLAYEDQFKPDATRAISGNIKPVTPDYVAKCLVRGIRKNKFLVIPTISGKITYFASKWFGPVLRWFLARTVLQVENRKK